MDKDIIKKQNIEYLFKVNTFFVANGCNRFIYTISSIYVVLLDLVQYWQKNEIFSFIIPIEKLIKYFQNSFLKRPKNSYGFLFTIAWSNKPKILQCLHHNIFKSMFNHFAMLHMNNLCNRCYIDTPPRVFCRKDFKLHKFHNKTPLIGSLFDKDPSPQMF